MELELRIYPWDWPDRNGGYTPIQEDFADLLPADIRDPSHDPNAPFGLITLKGSRSTIRARAAGSDPTVGDLLANVEDDQAAVGHLLHHYYGKYVVEDVKTKAKTKTGGAIKGTRQVHENPSGSTASLMELQSKGEAPLEVTVYLKKPGLKHGPLYERVHQKNRKGATISLESVGRLFSSFSLPPH